MSQRTISSPVQQSVPQVGASRSWKTVAAILLGKNALVLTFYAIVSLAVSWPTILHFTTQITGIGYDPLHNLWMLWHTQQVFLGQQPLFFAPDLYYPAGISLLAHGLGPVTGVFALPFWGWGPEAAHNGAVLVSLALTGYCMYLLARGLGFGRGVALFAGTMLLTSPIALGGIFGHLTKVFLGALPLVLLTLHHALAVQRNRWWVVGPGLALLLTLLHSGYQFVFAALSVGFFTVVLWLAAEREQRWAVFQRSLWTAGACVVVLGPLLTAVFLTSRDPTLAIDRNLAANHTPDALAIFTPTFFNWWSGERVWDIMDGYHITPSIESVLSLSWVGTLLCALGLLGGQFQVARRWVLFTLGCTVLALGPTLHWFGATTFTPFGIAIPLPYLLLKELPGLEFMRASGRLMMVGFVGFALAASFGLAWLTHRFPRQRYMIIAGSIALVLLESWPRPYPHRPLPPVPEFYRQLANDPTHYGVFDLPIESPYPRDSYITASAVYQVFQITHQKGIAAGYLSRTYAKPPVLPILMSLRVGGGQPHFQVNNQPLNVFAHARDMLARNNYRYVVWHKTLYPEPAGEEAWLNAVFGQEPPLIDDSQVRVYAVTPLTSTQAMSMSIELGTSWYAPEGVNWWWTQSPAQLFIHSPKSQLVQLKMQPYTLHDVHSPRGTGRRGVLLVEMEDRLPISVTISTVQTTTIPLHLHAGRQPLTLTLEAGNFRPVDYGLGDFRLLSFAMHRFNIETMDNLSLPEDITLNGQPQQHGTDRLMATHGMGWYRYEPPLGARWASSPATLFVYSPTAQQVELRFMPRWIYEVGVEGGTGRKGMLLIGVNTAPPQRIPARIEEIATAVLDLEAGWNTITLALEAGNFRPNDLVARSDDERELSFSLRWMDIVPR